MIVVAIDPGEKHNGVAVFGGDVQVGLVRTYEFDQPFLADWLEMTTVQADAVVMEEYRLYPWLLQEQGFSAVTTVEMIGVVRHICRRREWPLRMQSASIKKTAAGMMRARGVKLTGRNQHEKDAEMHGYYYLAQEGLWGNFK